MSSSVGRVHGPSHSARGALPVQQNYAIHAGGLLLQMRKRYTSYNENALAIRNPRKAPMRARYRRVSEGRCASDIEGLLIEHQFRTHQTCDALVQATKARDIGWGWDLAGVIGTC